ncbi:hypothetical protein DFH29DRAFT_930661, partial [Suillus ampliporus]
GVSIHPAPRCPLQLNSKVSPLATTYPTITLTAVPSLETHIQHWSLSMAWVFNGVLLIFIPDAGVFRKLFPLAAAHHLRIVSLYRRDYDPTTSFRDADMAGLISGTVEGQEGFLRSQAVEIATSLSRISGGIALIGWSLGSLHTHAVVAYLDDLPSDILSDLGEYLHTMVSHVSTYGSKRDVKVKFNLFCEWTTAYYLHKSFNKFSDNTHAMHELSSEELAELTSVETFGGSDTLLLTMTRRAIFNTALARRFLPNLRVRYMSGGASSGALVWTLYELRKCLADPEPMYGPDAEKARDVKVKFHTEGNHFVFWDEPQVALEQYITTINL